MGSYTSRNLLNSILLTVNNKVLCTSKFINRLVHVQTKKKKTNQAFRENFAGDGYVYYMDYGEVNMSVYIYANSPNCIN